MNIDKNVKIRVRDMLIDNEISTMYIDRVKTFRPIVNVL